MNSQSGKASSKAKEGILKFKASEVAVALHFVEKLPRPDEEPIKKLDGHSYEYMMRYKKNIKSELNVFKSMELDLLAYQFQKKPPIESGLPNGESKSNLLTELTIKLRKDGIDFFSEGEKQNFKLKKNEIKAEVRLSWTDFTASNLRIWHFVIKPSKNYKFDEYSIITLIHLYDGRAESTEIGNQIDIELNGEDISKDKDNVKSDTPIQILIKRLIRVHFKEHEVHEVKEDNDPLEIKFVAGTIQISQPTYLENNTESELQKYLKMAKVASEKRKGDEYDKLKEIYNDENKTVENSKMLNMIKAFGGIAIGIFDFDAVDFEEMLDTLTPMFSDDHIFIQMNRCTLFAFTPKDRVIDLAKVKKHIGISPYLLFPHSAIIHNETLVSLAEYELNKIKDRLMKEDLESASLKELEKEFESASLKLEDWQLPNVFNYVTERTLFEEGFKTRGSLDKIKSVKVKQNTVKDRIEVLWKLKSARGQILIASLIGALGGLALYTSNLTRIHNLLIYIEPSLKGYELPVDLVLFLIGIIICAYLFVTYKDFRNAELKK